MKNLDEINVACVLIGDNYRLEYVDCLYRMLRRNSTYSITLHVYTEPDRTIPAPYVKHPVPDLGQHTLGWWYKITLFDPAHFAGPLLYFDLDVVIVDRIDWVLEHDTDHLWAIRDFRKIWEPAWNGYNSSMMWFDTTRFSWLWDQFTSETTKRFRGDQDYITANITQTERRFFDDKHTASYRWQCKEGGWDFHERRHRQPNSGTATCGAGIIVFHGDPKPWEVEDDAVTSLWR